jgi:uncharacterized protein YraI
MKKKQVLLSVLAIWGLIMSCNMPFGTPTSPASSGSPEKFTETPSVVPPADSASTASPTFTPVVLVITSTPLPTETLCFPNAFAPGAANIRSGPGTIYDIIGGLSAGQNAKITGKSADGTWWYIEFSGRQGWVSGTVVTASCVPASLVVIAAPPTPIPTPTEVPAVFAVTHVNYAVGTWNGAGFTNCPRIAAKIRVNGPGTVTYHWTRSDGASGTGGTLVFSGAGAQIVTADWTLGSVWAPPPAEWMGIYIDSPNGQDFGHANMPACTAP